MIKSGWNRLVFSTRATPSGGEVKNKQFTWHERFQFCIVFFFFHWHSALVRVLLNALYRSHNSINISQYNLSWNHQQRYSISQTLYIIRKFRNKMSVNFQNEAEVKEYLNTIGIEYRFGCYSEKKPDGVYFCLNWQIVCCFCTELT